MNSKKLNGIYLHGYQGYVTDEKKNFLGNYGTIYAPNIDYDNEPEILYSLYDQFKDKNLDFVSGTSLGGLLIYHLALLLEVPCLVLNPAVTVLDQVKKYIPNKAWELKPKSQIYVLVGLKDEIVNSDLQLDFFNKINLETNKVTLCINEDLGHFIPLEDFELAFNEFKEMI
ncbi:hypothetical protein [Faecalibacter bovis]|uniref:Alpha/beta hydrolase n=1 Tax=Faecalibacter bovis TaxID=2898187 RepID=A0ABX7XBE6_9FLAO|nr:hypothetical protein [Faecalibacter bovis]QTV05117.1 hypothetical protein J9309_09980 [Faecalibacter bovis]